MKRSTFNYIQDILRDYPKLDKYIEEREEELRYPFKPTDINAGIQGNGRNDKMTNMLITIEEDKRITALRRNQRVISDNLDECDEDTKTIINELYLKKYPRYTMNGLVENKIIYCSRSQAFNLRNRFFENIADDLGLDK
ncbi:transcriptional regulator [Facklamia sp. P13064]|uniref:transcriptional regulator n=1 Tax=unclassified Facklamia TaxID=2622293 RepID=UPI003D17B49E